MVAYSNHSRAENEMATRAMLIRDAFMLPMEPLTARPYMEQGKEDSSHHHSKCYACWSVAYQCVPFVFIHERPNSVKSMKMSDTPPHDHDIDPTSSTTTQCKLHACRLCLLPVTSWHTALLSPTGPVEELPT